MGRGFDAVSSLSRVIATNLCRDIAIREAGMQMKIFDDTRFHIHSIHDYNAVVLDKIVEKVKYNGKKSVDS